MVWKNSHSAVLCRFLCEIWCWECLDHYLGEREEIFCQMRASLRDHSLWALQIRLCAPQRIKTVKQGLIPTRIQPTERWIKISLIPISRRSSQSISVPHNGAVQNPFIALSVCNSRQKLLGVLVLRNNNVLWLPKGACVPVRLPGTSAECLGLHLPCV